MTRQRGRVPEHMYLSRTFVLSLTIAACGGRSSLSPAPLETAATMAALLADGERTTVFLLGYHAPGDGGGGLFLRDASSAARDDGGTVVAAAGGGRWIRVEAGPLSAKWFGARGDGRADDAPAIQRAIDAADGRTVWLPAGTYRIDAPLTRRS